MVMIFPPGGPFPLLTKSVDDFGNEVSLSKESHYLAIVFLLSDMDWPE